MNLSESTSVRTSLASEHLQGQYSLQTAHLGLTRVSQAAASLGEGLKTLKNTSRGAQAPQLDTAALIASLEVAERSLLDIAATADALDSNVLQLFPAAAQRLDHATEEAGFELTKGITNFPERARELTGQVRSFALSRTLNAANVLCVMEAAVPSVSTPPLILDHSILVQMSNLAHL